MNRAAEDRLRASPPRTVTSSTVRAPTDPRIKRQLEAVRGELRQDNSLARWLLELGFLEPAEKILEAAPEEALAWLEDCAHAPSPPRYAPPQPAEAQPIAGRPWLRRGDR